MPTYVEYEKSSDNSAHPSPKIWADCPVGEFIEKGTGYFFQDDFIVVPEPALNTAEGAAQSGNYTTYTGQIVDGETTYQSVIRGDAGTGGEIFLGPVHNDSQCGIRGGGAPFDLSDGAAKFWFEARVKFSSVNNGRSGILFGLCEDASITNILPTTASAAIAGVNFIGFQRREGSGNELDSVWRKDTGNQETAANPPLLTADTYIKVGMKFENNSMSFYANGSLTSTVSNTDVEFPNDINLGLIYAAHGGSSGGGDAMGTTMDWWRVAQER